MKRVLVTGAGGSPAVNFTRSLRKAPEQFHLVGTDCDKYHLMRAETDQRYLVPAAQSARYIDVLNRIIDEEEIGFVHAQNDAEVRVLSENRELLHARTFLPSRRTVRICQDKFESYRCWQSAGLRVPGTMVIKSQDDLRDALGRYGGQLWIRAAEGAGAKGALPVHDFETGKAWLDFQKGWNGNFTAAELLAPDSITWMSVWRQGRLVVAQGRRRLYWELGRVSPSGVTGATGAAVTVSDPALDEISQRAVRAIDPEAEGLFGVDLTFDRNGVPNLTEINVGRFFTTHHFFTELGVNMPYIYTRLAHGEEPPRIGRRLNPAPDGMVWIRGIDFEPVLVSAAEIEAHVRRSDRFLTGSSGQ
jgi:carbamoyl-phosphate synthase large subunit